MRINNTTGGMTDHRGCNCKVSLVLNYASILHSNTIRKAYIIVVEKDDEFAPCLG
jgi:hypothetical protein